VIKMKAAEISRPTPGKKLREEIRRQKEEIA
jgi:hypothetical protein